MEVNQRLFWLLVMLCLLLGKCYYCMEPISAAALGAAGFAALGSAGYKFLYCKKFECCTPAWTSYTPNHLKYELDRQVFGQHLVNDVVSKVILDHVYNDEPKKALALSFHGWTGSGKNYVADIIVKSLYFKGSKSKYVHKRISPLHYSDSSKIEQYKEDLRHLIESETNKCARSLFIFDEVDKMPVGLADVIKPYLDHYPEINGVDYRKNIFIFLSNTGGEKINKETYNHFKSVKTREEITRKQMETILRTLSYNTDGGFRSSDLILSSLIDFFIPFLPLERKHVKECIKVSLRTRNKEPNEELLEKIASDLQYFPKGDETFSSTGCKLVDKKTSGHI